MPIHVQLQELQWLPARPGHTFLPDFSVLLLKGHPPRRLFLLIPGTKTEPFSGNQGPRKLPQKSRSWYHGTTTVQLRGESKLAQNQPVPSPQARAPQTGKSSRKTTRSRVAGSAVVSLPPGRPGSSSVLPCGGGIVSKLAGAKQSQTGPGPGTNSGRQLKLLFPRRPGRTGVGSAAGPPRRAAAGCFVAKTASSSRFGGTPGSSRQKVVQRLGETGDPLSHCFHACPGKRGLGSHNAGATASRVAGDHMEAMSVVDIIIPNPI